MEPAPGFLKRPSHEVLIRGSDLNWKVAIDGHLVCHTSRCLEICETGYEPRFYFPVSDIDLNFLVATDHSTYCPFKGTASYWTVGAGTQGIENGAWGYLDPYLECALLKDHICFYTEKSGFQVESNM